MLQEPGSPEQSASVILLGGGLVLLSQCLLLKVLVKLGERCNK